MANVTVKGLDEVINLTDTTMERAKDMTPALERARELMLTSEFFGVNKRFQTETDPKGKRWKPHKASTRAAYARERGSRPGVSRILTRSGTLRKSIIRGAVGDVDKDSFGIGTNTEYAAVHQFGFSGTVRVKSHTRKRSKKKKPKLNSTQRAAKKKASKAKARRRKIKKLAERNRMSALERAASDKKKRAARIERRKERNRRLFGSNIPARRGSGPIKVKAHAKRMSIPRREFLGFSEDDLEEIEDIVTDYLLTGE